MKWEHKTLVIETSGGWIKRGAIDISDFDHVLNEWGTCGFELVSAVPVSDGNIGTKRVVLFLKRPVSDKVQ